MSFDAFLLLDGIKGESNDAKHKGEIDVRSFSWGVAQTGAGHTGMGSGAGKADFQDLQIVKTVDKSTPLLKLACASGKHITKGKLTVRKAGEKSARVSHDRPRKHSRFQLLADWRQRRRDSRRAGHTQLRQDEDRVLDSDRQRRQGRKREFFVGRVGEPEVLG